MQRETEPASELKNSDDPSEVETSFLRFADADNTSGFSHPVDPNRTIAPSQDAPAPPHRMIGRYTVLAKLGSGGQADVFRAVHPTLPIEVAIKLSHGEIDDRTRQALRDEAHILCELDHPHIAKIRDFDFDNGKPFMVLDFIRGRSLAQVADSELPSPADAAAMVAKIARAIGFAHEHGVIHRDLKPENVVIDGKGEPQIIDFGMSRLRSALSGGAATEANEVSGTLAYMSPEQAEGIASQTDHRVDIFALGAILYRLIVGTPPYPRMPVLDLLRRVRRGDFDTAALDAADVPDTLKAICRQAMHRDPTERFATAKSMAEALDQVTGPSSLRHSAASRLRPTTLAVVAGLVAFVVLAGAAFFVMRSKPSAAAPTSTTSTPEFKSTQSLANSVVPANGPSDLIQDFDLIHIGNSAERAEFSGSLLQFRLPRENDDIQVRAEFTSPVYCFLVAMNPDGVKQLCYPSDAETKQADPISTLRYPSDEDSAFGLTDGAGQQAFVLFTSREPLPAFSDWESDLSSEAWPNPDVVGNWSYTSGELVALANPIGPTTPGTRGTVRDTKTPTPFKQLCDRLRKSETTDVSGVIFEVQPQ